MDAFLDYCRDWIAADFWRTLLFIVFTGSLLGMISQRVKKTNEGLGILIGRINSIWGIFICVFTWRVRGHIGWLIWGSIGISITIAFFLFNRFRKNNSTERSLQ